MGDVGSTYLGALYASFVLRSDSFSSLISTLLLCSPLLMDSFFCVLRRFLAGQPIFLPHRLHLYQRLHQSGLSHASVSSLYASATFLCCLTYFFGGFFQLIAASLMVFSAGYCLDRYIAVPFSK